MSISSSSLAKYNTLSPSRIETARLRRGLTQAAAAELVGVTDRTFRRYEQEGAPFERLRCLAQALEYPPKFFTRDDGSDMATTDVAFRAGRRAPNKAKSEAVAVGRCGIELDHYLQRRFILPGLELPDLAGNSPRTAARLLRDQWGLGDAPLPNLVQLCESRGIRVYGLPRSAYAVDAYSYWTDGVPYIFLARRRTPEGVRFDVAHEIGHLVMHAHDNTSPEIEHEADVFASEFVLPRTSLAAYLPSLPTVNDILRLRSRYRISAMAAAVAANRAGFMSDSSYRRTCTLLGKKGFRTSEPGGMSSYETSRVFARIFTTDLRKGLSVKKIAEDLGFPTDDVHALTLSTRLHTVPKNTKEKDSRVENWKTPVLHLVK